MADDRKRTEPIACKVTERMLLDINRLSVSRGRSVSNLLYEALRTKLYGEMVRLEDSAAQMSTDDKVNRGDE
jgi:hypothetical protein